MKPQNQLKIAVHNNDSDARIVMTTDYMAHVVLVIYPIEEGEPSIRIFCADEAAVQAMLAIFPDAIRNPAVEGKHEGSEQEQPRCVLSLNGSGDFYLRELRANFPEDNSWSYRDFRHAEYQ